jgi:Holliday junction resolvase-like predicted endonuclease
VKGARSLSFGQPEERVDFAKRRHLNDAALAYLQAHEPEASEYRWDVVTVTYAKGAPTINHLRNAFTAD